MSRFVFPVGYHRMHKTKILDYQLNRWHSLGYARLEDMRVAAERIRTLGDWMPEMVRQAEIALQEDRILNATFYYRAAEFFTPPDDPEKERLYEKFQDLFYHRVVENDPVERSRVPFDAGFLPVLRVRSHTDGDNRKTIVMFGGFDSFMEELYSWACCFADHGYDVVLFEGPGQGGALKLGNLVLNHEWEKPTGAILNHFQLDDVTLLGVSMGGWLVFRAAALEPRVTQVIASSVVFDYQQIPPAPVAAIARWMLARPSMMNTLARLNARLSSQERWGLNNLMYITRKETPTEAAKVMLAMNEKNILSDQVKQDVLILSGAEDHFIPAKMHHKQVAALTNARSVTARVFTRVEHAENHCQVGNMGLALDVMAKWIAERLKS